ISDLLDAGTLRRVLEGNIREKRAILPSATELSLDKIQAATQTLGQELSEYFVDTAEYLNRMMDQGKRVLFEGAQGTLLDVDPGTYPFVTASSATAGGACTGTGVGPTRIDGVVGI